MKLKSLNKMLLEILRFKWKNFGIEEIKHFEILRFNQIFPKLYGLKKELSFPLFFLFPMFWIV